MSNLAKNNREKVHGWIGAIIGGGIFLLASCLQPIDGVPGYQLITREDFSIIFGFGLAALVGGVIGYVPGIIIGREIDGNRASKEHQKRTETLKLALEEFQEEYLERLFLQAEEQLSAGQTPQGPEISDEILAQVIPPLVQKYDLSQAELDEIIARFAASQGHRT